mgnify:CR=1 FL=1
MKGSEPNLKLIYQITNEAIKKQISRKNVLESKAQIAIAFNGGILGLLINAINNILSQNNITHLLFFTSVVFISISIILAGLVLWTQKYRTDPNPEVLSTKYLNSSANELYLQLISNLTEAWKIGHQKNETKALILRFSYLTLLLGFVIIGISLFLSLS